MDSTTNTTKTNPLTIPTESSLISHDVRSLHELALRGTWRKLLTQTESSLSNSNNLRFPHDHLVHVTINVISLTKLRRYSDALNLIETDLENLDNPSYCYEAFPHLYPTRSGSMIPFALRWLHAVLPSFLSRKSDSLDRLYLLLAFVRKKFALSSSSADVWRRREEFVASTIVSIHSINKEYLVCLGLLNDMISKDANNIALLSKLGYVKLQFGDIDGAKSTFTRVENIVEEAGNDVEGGRNLVGRNKALVYMVGKDYVSAVREYDECIERDGEDVVAINNKALCLMYLRDLSDSIKVLENSLERVPTAALNETLVVNLCSMYELAFVNHTDIKKTLSNWIARLAPDDFDSSCTRV